MHSSTWKMRLSAAMLAIFLLIMAGSASSSLGASQNRSIELNFSRHIDFPVPMPVQDVYVVINESTPDLVYRATPEQVQDPEILALEAYATTNHTPHDPLMETAHPTGPFPRGSDLGFSLGDWLAARGEGIYSEQNGNATMDLVFRNLIPNGTYSVWWAGVTHEPYRFVVAPAGAPNGTENSFKADASGSGAFHVRMSPLPPGSNQTRTLIAVRYHSDGQVPGSAPGAYGKTAHVQLLYRLPLPEVAGAQMSNASGSPAQSAEKQPGFAAVLTLAGLLGSAYLIRRGRK